jgi:hypothetical protein
MEESHYGEKEITAAETRSADHWNLRRVPDPIQISIYWTYGCASGDQSSFRSAQVHDGTRQHR